MRLKFVPLVAAILGLATIANSVHANHCGAFGFPGALRSDRWCMPQIKYKVCYETVWEDRVSVKYRPVYETVMKECRYTTYERCYEKGVKEVRYTECKPACEKYCVEQKYAVCKPVV